MEDYELITRLGGGSFADVYKAREKSSGDFVAIKVLKKKYKKWEDCLELRECRSLQKLHNESLSNQKGIENIIKLKQIIFIKKTGTLNLVFEFMERDLLELMKSKEPGRLQENQIRDIMYQTLLGLAYMHKYGFFHRDMKPENLLLVGDKVKIADFGLAREIRSAPPYTEYVSTRFYRAPECILKSSNYNSPVDIWALGCIMAEMYLHPQPLFYGSNEKEVLMKICTILGSPSYDTWADGIQQANFIGIKFPNNSSGTNLENVIPLASEEAIDLMKQMLQWDPNRRSTANTLLGHPFFTNNKSNININLNNNNENLASINISNFDLVNDNKVKKYNNKQKCNININNNLNDNKNVLNNNINNSTSISISKQSNAEDNNISKLLNDTDGFDKLLTQLKKEKIEQDKYFEKEKNKFGNDLEISNIVYNNLDGTNFSINKSNALFNQSSKINTNGNGSNSNTLENELSYLNPNQNSIQLIEDQINIKNSSSNHDSDKKNLDNNEKIAKKNERKKSLLGDEKITITNKDNNEELKNKNINSNINLKPKSIIQKNRIRSARKFLEETEGNFGRGEGLSFRDKAFNNISPGGNKVLVFNYDTNNKYSPLGGGTSNNIITTEYDTKKYINNKEINRLFDNSRNNLEIGESGYKRKEFNYGVGSGVGPGLFSNNDSLFHIGSRRNHIPNNNAIWGIK